MSCGLSRDKSNTRLADGTAADIAKALVDVVPDLALDLTSEDPPEPLEKHTGAEEEAGPEEDPALIFYFLLIMIYFWMAGRGACHTFGAAYRRPCDVRRGPGI